jgi:serine/threonine protein phosphatase PrpC
MNEDYVSHLKVAGRSDIGLHRTINQDAYRTQVPAPGFKSRHALFAVADGVGGNLPRGEVASRTAVDRLVEAYYALPEDTDSLTRIRQALQSAHEAVKQQASSLAEAMIGTTIAGVALTPAGEAVVFNVGDSRVYRIRNHVTEQISHDQVMLDAPNVLKDEFQEKRTTTVTSYLGQPKTLEPNFYRLKVQPDDIFVVCSDGVWSVVREPELQDVVTRMPIEAAADHLVELIRQRNAADNLTLIIIKLSNAKSGAKRWRRTLALLLITVLIGIAAVFIATQNAETSALMPTTSLTQTVETLSP